MRRPLMWAALLGIAVLFLLAGVYERIHPLPDYSGEAVICGRLVKKEVKNDNLVLYLKEVSICSDLNHYSQNEAAMKTENAKWKRLAFRGFVCYADLAGEENPSSEDVSGFVIGRKTVLRGEVSCISKATNPGEFDAGKYYRARGYRYVLYQAKDAGGKAEAGRLTIPEMMYRLRRICSAKNNDYLGRNYGGILSAMLFGEKENLSKDVKEMYRDGGISHILAISGLHISLIGAFLYALLTFFPLPKKASFVLTVGILFLYGLMVGFAPSVFRAVFMFSYRLLVRNLKKAYDPPTALALGAFLTCLAFPFMVQDGSFLLTYLAFGGIVFLYPCLESAKPGKKKWTDGFFVSFSVFAVTLPVILRSFNSVSFGGFLLNMLVIPAMPVLFACAFILVAFSFFFPRGASLFALLTKSILFAMESAVRIMNRFSFIHLNVKAPQIGRVLIYTTFVVLIAAFTLSLKRRMKLKYYHCLNEAVRLMDSGQGKTDTGNGKPDNGQRKQDKITEELRIVKAADLVRRILFFVLVSLGMIFLMTTPKKAGVTFLDVGQGDGIFIRTGDGKVYMVDGGSTSKKNVGEKIIVPYLRYEGEKAVDVWFLTHEDADHINGFEQVLADGEIVVRAIALPVVSKEDETDFWKVKHLAKQRGIPVLYLKEGDIIGPASQGAEYFFRVMSPNPHKRYEDRNDSSLVLLYESQNRRYTQEVFLMGDSTVLGEEAVKEYFMKKEGKGAFENAGKETVAVLKCAHHGSANDSNSEDFILGLKPDYAVISCGRNNVYGHPHKETVERLRCAGSEMYLTSGQGAIFLEKNMFGKFRIRGFIR